MLCHSFAILGQFQIEHFNSVILQIIENFKFKVLFGSIKIFSIKVFLVVKFHLVL